MTPFRPFSRHVHVHVHVCFVLLAASALAALQNVTVDDAILIGAVVPQYLPSPSEWNIGNNCTVCLAKPDPALAYNGTWHDTTYHPDNGFTQVIEFSFTGSALYIFFIIANNVTGAATLTDVELVLDENIVGTYTHAPLTTTDYVYNVPVFADDSLAPGEHNVMIQPVDSKNQVLMLFDYLIYTIDTLNSTSSSSVTSASTSSLLPSTTISGTHATSLKQNIGAIVGGTVGGVTALVLVIASLLCYRRYKRRDSDPKEVAVLEPFTSSREVAPTTFVDSTSYSAADLTSRYKMAVSSVLPPSTPPATITASSSSGVPSGNNSELLGQVEQLRDEVARLRHLHNRDLDTVDLRSELPPEYS